MDIHKGRGNANKLMNRFLSEAHKSLNVSVNTIDGGSLRNAIPRESLAIIVVDYNQAGQFEELVAKYQAELEQEYNTTDPELAFIAERHDKAEKVLDPTFQGQLLRSLYACPNGIYRMSPEIKDLVQTSNNLARVLVKDGAYKILCLTRSSVDSEKMDEANAIISTFELMGASVEAGGEYPGWAPKSSAKIVQLMDNIYQELYKEKPQVKACHAGLECGILGLNYPNMEMISFGPNIRGAHSPDERAQISSVQKFWGFLLETLKRI